MSDQASLVQCLKVLLPFVPSREKWRFVFLLVLACVMAFVELALTGMVALLAAIFASPEAVLNNNPVLWFRTVTGISLGNDHRLLALSALVAILAAIVIKNALTILQQWNLSVFSESVGVEIRGHIFRFYQRAPFLWVLHTGVANLGFGLAAVTQFTSALSMSLQVFTSLLMMVTLFIGLLVVSPIPSLMFLGVLGIGGTLVVKGTRAFIDRYAKATYYANFRLAKITHLALHGLKEMRLYGRENALFGAYTGQLREVAQANRAVQTTSRLPVASLEILGFCTLVAVMCFLVFAQNAGMARISGVMGFLAAAAWRVLPVANRLVDALTQLRTGLPYLRKTAESISLEKELAAELLPLTGTQPELLLFSRDILLDGVTFAYPDTASPALTNVSMRIPKGSMVGLVGFSGAGKSTLVNLMTGLIPPTSGNVFVDGVAVTRKNVGGWLRRIGYVAQNPYIIDASLAENVALSRWGEEIDRDRVLECCRMAALDFLDELERGVDTVLGDRGVRLSGGQAQRVAIARALYSEPDLIIFDEATGALDMKNEKAIHETILSLREHVTMVIIAHRLTTVEGCDSIVWLDKGAVRMSGETSAVLAEYCEAIGPIEENT